MSRKRIDWEEPEISDWEYDGARSSDDRCLPGIALVTAVGAFAFCRPRNYYYCRPRYFYGGYGIYGWGGGGCYPYRFCYPRPCRPL